MRPTQMRPRTFRPVFEALEDRAVPSGITKIQDLGTQSAADGAYQMSIVVPAQGVATGNTILIEVANHQNNTGAAVGVVDTAGNAYAKDADFAWSGLRVLVFSAPAQYALSGGGTITVTMQSQQAPVEQGMTVASAAEFSGLLAVDQTHTDSAENGGVMAPTSGTANPTTQPDELLLGAIGAFLALYQNVPAAPVAFTPGAGYTALGTATDGDNAGQPHRI